MKFGGAKSFLECLFTAQGAIEAVGIEEVVVVKDDVVDADDGMFAESEVVEARLVGGYVSSLTEGRASDRSA